MSNDADTPPAAQHIHIDPLGGIAGDMFLAAAIDVEPAIEADIATAIAALGLDPQPRIDAMATQDCGLAGRSVNVANAYDGAPHRTYTDITEMIDRSTLAPPIRARAADIFRRLAEAEARVHGCAAESVHLHEAGAIDAIVDIVGAATAIESFAPTSWSVGSLPLGSGTIVTAHGILPVPAPAVQILLEGFIVHDDGRPGERVTPTGAAILCHLAPLNRLPDGVWQAAGSGCGFGRRRFEALPNMLRLRRYLNAGAAAAAANEEVAVIAFQIDDQTPEDLALGLDIIRAMPEVLEVTQIPAFAKKGRLAQLIQILCRPEARAAVEAACFTETTTIGLRSRLERRTVLPRTERHRDGIRVKSAVRPDGRTTRKAEAEDLRQTGGGQQERRRLRQRLELNDD